MYQITNKLHLKSMENLVLFGDVGCKYLCLGVPQQFWPGHHKIHHRPSITFRHHENNFASMEI